MIEHRLSDTITLSRKRCWIRNPPTRSAFPAVIGLLIVVALAMAGCADTPGDAVAVGDAAPDFALPAASGSTVSLSDYAGEPVLLYFHMAEG